MDCLAPLPNPADPALEVPRAVEPGGLLPPEEVPPPPAVYSPSNAVEWLDGHSTDSQEALDAVEPVVWLDASSDGANVSPQLLAGLEEGDLEVEPLVERVSHPARVAAVSGGAEIVTMRELRQSSGVAIEARTPELRLQRLIQVIEQHRIARSGPVSRNQRATSPETERLVLAIQRSHSSLDASKRHTHQTGGIVAAKKDGCCGCNYGFECNICLETAKEPLVTPCGHLFCWPCLHQWFHRHSAHSECPVCKGEVLHLNVTPIYGTGAGERDASSNDVPPRPRANTKIQVIKQHRIARSGPVSRKQRATSPETERLVLAIQRSHRSLDASKRQKLDGDDKVGGIVAAKKDGCCVWNSSFECNICLETAKDPLVTSCGHLFCSTCLYQWFHGHSAHSDKCPVCKGEVRGLNACYGGTWEV